MSVETNIPGSFRDAILDARKAIKDGKDLRISPCMGNHFNGNGTKPCKDFDPTLSTLCKTSEGLIPIDGHLECPEQRGRIVLSITDSISDEAVAVGSKS